MDRNPLRIKLYGVRGSYTPTKGFRSKIGVNTICIRADIGEHTIIFDAGTGIINCGSEIQQELTRISQPPEKYRLHLFFSHLHLDHLEGFPYFPPAYDNRCEIHFLSPRILNWTVERAFTQLIHPPLFPLDFGELAFQRHFHQIAENLVVYFNDTGFIQKPVNEPMAENWLLKISTMRNFLHPKGGSYSFRLETPEGKSAVFAYDTEGFIGGDQRLIAFAKNADLLFHDAQYTTDEYPQNQGYGHSTYQMACEVASLANVGKLMLIHHDPNHCDEDLMNIQNRAQKLFSNAFVAVEESVFVL